MFFVFAHIVKFQLFLLLSHSEDICAIFTRRSGPSNSIIALSFARSMIFYSSRYRSSGSSSCFIGLLVCWPSQILFTRRLSEYPAYLVIFIGLFLLWIIFLLAQVLALSMKILHSILSGSLMSTIELILSMIFVSMPTLQKFSMSFYASIIPTIFFLVMTLFTIFYVTNLKLIRLRCRCLCNFSIMSQTEYLFAIIFRHKLFIWLCLLYLILVFVICSHFLIFDLRLFWAILFASPT